MKFGGFPVVEAQNLITIYNTLEYRMLFFLLSQLMSNKNLLKYVVENLDDTKCEDDKNIAVLFQYLIYTVC